jgi:hypothetical protein
MDSGTDITSDIVFGGNPNDTRPFASLSKSGKIVNAYNALVMAKKTAENTKGKR